MKKSPQEERKIILQKPEKRPYGIRVEFNVQTLGEIGNIENICIDMESGIFLTLKSVETAPWESRIRIKMELEGFSTALAAEIAGKKLVQSLLWTAIKQKSALQLQYNSYEPAYVFERNRSLGFSCQAYGESIKNPQKIIDNLHEGYFNLPEPDPRLLLSMEIFAGAKLETSERATYLAMVSALEPLGNSQALGDDVNQFVLETLENLKSNNSMSSSVKNSLAGRIRELRNESIGQSLKRLAKEQLPENENAETIIKEAYSIRSQLIHTGKPNDLDIDLTEKGYEIEKIIGILHSPVGTLHSSI